MDHNDGLDRAPSDGRRTEAVDSGMDPTSGMDPMPGNDLMPGNDQAVELEQRPLPKFSILAMIATVTVMAVGFWGLRLAIGGNLIAQVIYLILAIAIVSLLAYASVFLVGFLFHLARTLTLRSPTSANSAITNPATADPALADPAPLDSTTSSSPTSSSSTTRTLWLIPLLAASLSLPGQVAGQAFPKGQVLHPGKPRVPYRIQFTFSPAPGNGGYQRVGLEFRPLGTAFRRRREVEVEITCLQQNTLELVPSVRQTFIVPEGATTHREQILLPRHVKMSLYRIEAFEDGRSIGRDASYHWPSANTLDVYAGQATVVGVIADMRSIKKSVVGSVAPSELRGVLPDVRSLNTVMGNGPLIEEVDLHSMTRAERLNSLQSIQPAEVQFRPLAPEDAENWLALSDLDIILADGRQLEWFCDQASDQAIRRFVAAGGSLWIYGTEHDALARLDVDAASMPILADRSIVALQPLRQSLNLGMRNDTSGWNTESWNNEPQRASVYDSSMQQRQKRRRDVFDELVQANHPVVRIDQPADLASKIHSGPYGLGRIVDIAMDDPFPGSLQMWRSIADVEDEMQYQWELRNGYSPSSGSESFWTYRIESLGGPPVRIFLVLNSLFVVLIGPVAYFLLRRRRRLYLLYFLAPATAVMITASLFTFAVFRDGIAAKTRVFQVTVYDGKNDVTVGWDRNTSYSALGNEPIVAPADMRLDYISPTPTVRPYSYSGTNQRPTATLRWADDRQYLSGDYVAARQQTQYQCVWPQVNDATCPRFKLDSTSGTVTVENRSPFRMRSLIYRDTSNRYHTADDVEAGQTVKMTPHVGQPQALTDGFLPNEAAFVPNVSGGWIEYGNYTPATHQNQVTAMLRSVSRGLGKEQFVAHAELDVTRMLRPDALRFGCDHVVFGTAP